MATRQARRPPEAGGTVCHPLTRERWADFEALFGPRGACGGCWCMWWRLSRQQFERGKGESNRLAMRSLVEGGAVPGLLAYVGDVPAGWCAVAPREVYPGLSRSRILKPVDDKPVWSVTCFFIGRAFRGQGLTVALLQAALEHAASQGARIVEGYPTEPTGCRLAPAFAYTGLAASFLAAGFSEVARRSPSRPIMRAVASH